ncbi:MAG: LuxR C-terminal-related transcriptional regulator, partial [Oscillospiraceae bacterium]
MLTEKSIPFPKLSATSNIPSTMNGGKDFCEWSKRDREFASTFGKIVAAFTGSLGRGLVNIGLAESLYEKGGDYYEITSLISKAKNQMESGDLDYNMLYVAEGLYARLCIISGEIAEARETLENFYSRTKKTKYIYKLENNIEASLCNVALYEGNNKAMNDWFRTKAPDENDFFIMNRYQYITKILCYMAMERYAPALALIDRLNDYAQLADRKYISMQLAILKSIIKYRRNDEWKNDFTQALYRVKEYDFIRIVSEQGAAVYPLLDAVRAEFSEDKNTSEWFNKLIDETHRMMIRYPVYLKTQMINRPVLSENAVKILKLQAEGLTLKKIGERLGITERTVKFHAQETYRKLGANNRTDAILAAKNLNII